MNDMVAIQVGQGSRSKIYYVSLALLLASGLTLPAGAAISLPNPTIAKMMAAGVNMGSLSELAKSQFVAWGTTDSTPGFASPVQQPASPGMYWDVDRLGASILATDANLTLGAANGLWTSVPGIPDPIWTAIGATHDANTIIWAGGVLGAPSSLFSAGMLAGGDKTITVDNGETSTITLTGGSMLQVNDWDAGPSTWDELILNTGINSTLNFASNNGTLVLADDYNALRSTWTLGNSQTTLSGIFGIQLGVNDPSIDLLHQADLISDNYHLAGDGGLGAVLRVSGESAATITINSAGWGRIDYQLGDGSLSISGTATQQGVFSEDGTIIRVGAVHTSSDGIFVAARVLPAASPAVALHTNSRLALVDEADVSVLGIDYYKRVIVNGSLTVDNDAAGASTAADLLLRNLTGNGNITISNDQILQVQNDGYDASHLIVSEFSGNIIGGAGVTLRKTGIGTQTLTGNVTNVNIEVLNGELQLIGDTSRTVINTPSTYIALGSTLTIGGFVDTYGWYYGEGDFSLAGGAVYRMYLAANRQNDEEPFRGQLISVDNGNGIVGDGAWLIKHDTGMWKLFEAQVNLADVTVDVREGGFSFGGPLTTVEMGVLNIFNGGSIVIDTGAGPIQSFMTHRLNIEAGGTIDLGTGQGTQFVIDYKSNPTLGSDQEGVIAGDIINEGHLVFKGTGTTRIVSSTQFTGWTYMGTGATETLFGPDGVLGGGDDIEIAGPTLILDNDTALGGSQGVWFNDASNGTLIIDTAESSTARNVILKRLVGEAAPDAKVLVRDNAALTIWDTQISAASTNTDRFAGSFQIGAGSGLTLNGGYYTSGLGDDFLKFFTGLTNATASVTINQAHLPENFDFKIDNGNTMILGGDNRYFTGDVTLSNGRMVIVSANALGEDNQADISFSSSNDEVILRPVNSGDSWLYSGKLSGLLGGRLILDAENVGSVTLIGDNSNFLGDVIIQSGNLKVEAVAGGSPNSPALGIGSAFASLNAIEIYFGGQLELSNSGSSVWTMERQITGAGQLIKDGDGKLILTADNVAAGFHGGFDFRAGTVEVDYLKKTALGTGAAGANVINLDDNGRLTLTSSGGAASWELFNKINGSGTLSVQFSDQFDVLTLAGDVSAFTGVIEVEAGTLKSNSIFGAGATVNLKTADVSVWEVTNEVLIPLSLDTALAGEGTFRKIGAGDIQITGINTSFSGKIEVSDGRLIASSQTALGSTSQITLGDVGGTAGILQFNHDDAATIWYYDGAISMVNDGNGLEKNGAGTVVLQGTLDLAGGANNQILVKQGEFRLDQSAIQVDGSGTIVNLPAIIKVEKDGYFGLTTKYGADWIFTGDIQGEGGFVKDGAGILTLNPTSGTLTYKGETVVRDGTLRIEGDVLRSSLVNVAAGADVEIGKAGAYTLSIAGAGNLTINLDNATDILSLANINAQYTGVTDVKKGILVVPSVNSLGTSTALRLETDGMARLTVADGAADILTQTLLGDGTIEKYGGGTLSLAPTNGIDFYTDFKGLVDIKEGTLQIDNAELGPEMAINLEANTKLLFMMDGLASSFTLSGSGLLVVHTATWDLLGNNANFTGDVILTSSSGANLTLSNAMALGDQTLPGLGTVQVGGGTVLAITNNTGDDWQFSREIYGDGSFVKDGSGKLTLTNVNNSFNGGVTVNDGVLAITGQGVLGFGPVDVAGADAVLEIDYFGTFERDVSGGGALAFNPGLGNTLTVSGNNSYSGATRILSGTVLATHQNALGAFDSGDLEILAGAKLTMEVNGTTWSGFGKTLYGTGTLEKTGDGVFQVTGDNNFFAGAILVTQGMLSAESGSALGTGSVSIDPDGILRFLNDAAPGAANNWSYTGSISGDGQLRKSGQGVVVLVGDNSGFGGNIRIEDGRLVASSAVSLGDTSVATREIEIAGVGGVLELSNSGAPWTVANLIYGAGAITKSGSGVVELTNASNFYMGGTTISDGTLRVTGGEGVLGTSSTVTLGSQNAVLEMVDALAFTKDVVGTGTLRFSGTSSLTIERSLNQLTGTLDIDAGSHLTFSGTQAGIGSAANQPNIINDGILTLTASADIVANGLYGGEAGELQLNTGNSVLTINRGDFSGDISGNGIIRKVDNNGIFRISGDGSAFTGRLELNNGVIRIHGSDVSLGTAQVNMEADTSLDVNDNILRIGTLNMNGGTVRLGLIGSGRLVVNGGNLAATSNITENGTLEFAGGYTTVLGANSYNGDTIIRTDATVRTNNVNALSQADLTMESGSELRLASDLDLRRVDVATGSTITLYGAILTVYDGDLAGTITGGGGLTKNGGGLLTISGDNSYSGTTTINAGTVEVSSDTAFGSSNVLLASADAWLRYQAGVVAIDNDISGAGNIELATGGNVIMTHNLGVTGTIKLTDSDLTLQGIRAKVDALADLEVGTRQLTLENASISFDKLMVDSGSVTIDAGSRLEFKRGVLGGTLSGSGRLSVSAGSATDVVLVSGDVSAFSGEWQINTDGIVRFYDDPIILDAYALETSMLTLTGNSTLDINNTEVTLGAFTTGIDTKIQLGGTGGTLRLSGGGTLNSTVSGSGDVVIDGGFVIMTAANEFSGTTQLQNGAKLQVTDSLALGHSVLDADLGTELILGSDTDFVLSLEGGTVYATISGGGSLRKIGGGSLVLMADNTFQGTTAVEEGVLEVMSNAALSTGAITVAAESELVLSGTVSGIFKNSLSSSGTLTINTPDEVILRGDLTNLAGLVEVLSGTLTLDGANADSIAADTLDVKISDAGTLKVRDGNFSLRSLSGLGNLTLASGAASNLTVTDIYVGGVINLERYDSALTVVRGDIAAMVGLGHLEINGAITDVVAFSGPLSDPLDPASVFSGRINVNGGTMRLETGDELTPFDLTTAELVTVNGGTLDINGHWANFNHLLTQAGSTLDLNGGTLTVANLETGGTLNTQNGAINAIRWTMLDTFTMAVEGQDMAISAETLVSKAGSVITLGEASTLTIQSANATLEGAITGEGRLRLNAVANDIPGIIRLGGNIDIGDYVYVDGGTVELFNDVSMTTRGLYIETGATFGLGDTRNVIIDAIGGGGTLNTGSLQALANTLTVSYGDFSGFLVGAGKIVKVGAERLTLSGDNATDSAFTGEIDVRAGDLLLNGSLSAYRINSAADTNIYVQDTMTLTTTAFDGAGNVFINGALEAQRGLFSGSLFGTGGTLTKSGLGILEFSGDNLGYAGEIIVESGILRATNANALGTGSVTVNDGAILEYATTGNVLAALAGNGEVRIANQGMMSLFGDTSLFTGVIRVMDGQVTLASEVAYGMTAPTEIQLESATATLNLNAPGTLTAAVTGLGGIVKNGVGEVILDAANSYMGSTIVHGGTLTVLNLDGLGNTSGITLDASTALKVLAAGAIDLGANIDGAGVVMVGDTLTAVDLTLSGNNQNFSGTVSVQNGSLKLGSQNAIGTAGVALLDGTTLIIDNSVGGSIWNIANTLSGPGNIEKLGAGRVILSGNNSGLIGGSILVKQGTLEAVGAVALGSQTDIVLGDTIGGTDATLALNNADAVTPWIFDGVISEDAGRVGSLEKTGVGTIILTEAQTYTGTTLVSGGTLIVQDQLTSTDVKISDPAAVFEISYTGSTPWVWSGAVISGQGGFTKSGVGTLQLDTAQRYLGATTITEGTLSLTSAGELNAQSLVTVSANGTLELDINTFQSALAGNGTVRILQGLTLSRDSSTFAGAFDIAGAGIAVTAANQNALGSAALRIGAGNTLTIDNNSLTGSWTLANRLLGDGTFIKTGSGRLLLTGANDEFNGTIQIDDGSLEVQSLVALGSGTTIDAAIADSRLILNNATAGTTWYSDITVTGLGGLEKAGAGTVVMTEAQTYEGDTKISGGQLTVQNQIASTDVKITDPNAIFEVSYTGSLDWDWTGAVISGQGSFIKSGVGTLVLDSAQRYLGTTTINEGTLSLINDGSLNAQSLVTVAADGTLELDINSFQNALAGNGTVRILQSLTLSRDSSAFAGAFDIAGSGIFVTAVNQNALGSAALRIGDGNTLTIDNSSLTGSWTLDNRLLGDGTFLKTGSGRLLLTGANDEFNGTIRVDEGALEVQSLAALGTGTTIDVAAIDASLILNNTVAGSTWYSDIMVTNLGGLEKAGAGTVVLTEAQHYTGTTKVSGGQLTVQDTLASTDVKITDQNAVFEVSYTGSTAWDWTGAVISGQGSFTKSGVGTLQLDTAQRYLGATTINEGTLRLTGAAELNAQSLVTVAADGTLELDINTFHNHLAGAGTVRVLQDLTLSGDNSNFSGAFDISSALPVTLTMVHQNALGTAALRIGAGNTLTIDNNSLTGSWTLANRLLGDGTFIKAGSGRLLLTGANDEFNGTIQIDDGALEVQSLAALGTGTTIDAASVDSSLIINNDVAGSTWYSDVVVTGQGGLEKAGAGIVMMTEEQTYLGDTKISGGTLIVQDKIASTDVKVTDPAAIFEISYTGSSPWSWTGGVISGQGGFTKSGVGILELDSAQRYLGATTINEGTLRLTSSGSLNAQSLVTVAADGTLELDVASFQNRLAGAGTVRVLQSLTLANANINFTGAFDITGAGTVLTVANQDALGTALVSIDTASILRLSSSSLTSDWNLSNRLVGSGTVEKTGLGVIGLVSGTPGDFTGNLSILEGTIRVDNLLAIGDADVDVAVDAMLQLNAAGRYDGVISGGGSVKSTAAGRVVLSSNQAYTGETVVDTGSTLAFEGTLASSNIRLLAADAAVEFANVLDQTYVGNITGLGGIAKSGSGILTLTGTNTYAGATTIDDGTVFVTSDQALGSNASIVFGSNTAVLELSGVSATAFLKDMSGMGTLRLSDASDLTVTRNLSQMNGTVEVSEDSALTFSGPNAALGAGAWINNAGSMTVTDKAPVSIGNLYSTGSITVDNLSSLNFANGQLAGEVTVAGDMTKTGAGLLLLGDGDDATTNTFSFDNGFQVNGGTIRVMDNFLAGDITGTVLLNGVTVDVNGKSLTIENLQTPAVNEGLATVYTFTGGDLNANVARVVVNADHNTAIISYDGTVVIGNSIVWNEDGSFDIFEVKTDEINRLVTINSPSSRTGIIYDLDLTGTYTVSDEAGFVTDSIIDLGISGDSSLTIENGFVNAVISGLGSITYGYDTTAGKTGYVSIGGGLTANTYDGTTLLQNVVANIANVEAFGVSSVTMGENATLRLSGSDLRVNSLNSASDLSSIPLIDLGNDPASTNALIIYGNGDSAFYGSIVGTGDVVKQGTGTLTLGGTSTYSGVTTIEDGRIIAASEKALGNSRQINLNSASSVLEYQNDGASTWLIRSLVSTQKTAEVILGLGGEATEANYLIDRDMSGYHGRITLDDGVTLTVNSPDATFATATNLDLDLDLKSGSTLALDNANVLLNRLISADGSTVDIGIGSTLTINGGVLQGDLTGAGQFTLADNDYLEISGAKTNFTGTFNLGGALRLIGDTSFGDGMEFLMSTNASVLLNEQTVTIGSALIDGLGMTGHGDVVYNHGMVQINATLDYTGTTTIDGASINSGADHAFGASDVSLINGGQIDLVVDLTVETLSADDTTEISLGAQTLTVINGADQTISANIHGTGTLALLGGTLTLDGANTYTNGTTIDGGTLQVASAGALSTGAVTVGGAGELKFIDGSAGIFKNTLTSTGTLSLAMDSATDEVILRGNLTALAGIVDIQTGTLVLDGVKASTVSATLDVKIGDEGTLKVNDAAITVGTISGTGDLMLGRSANSSLTATNVYLAGTATLEGYNSVLRVNGGDIGMITGLGRVEANGVATDLLVLSGDNDFSGGLRINGSTVRIGSDGSALGTGLVELNTGTLQTNDKSVTVGELQAAAAAVIDLGRGLGTDSLTVTGGSIASVIHGNGHLIIGTDGDVTITGNALTDFIGKTEIGDGATLSIGASTTVAALGHSQVEMDAGSTLDLRNNNLTIYGLSSIADDTDLQPAVILGDTATTILTVVTDRDSAFGGQIIGSGSLVKAGSGTLTLSGNNTFTGATSVTGGMLQIDDIDALKGTSGVTLADETVLFYNNTTSDEWTIKSVTGTATSEIRLQADSLNKYVVDRNMTAFQGIWGIDGVGGYTLTLRDLAQINATKLNLQNGAKLVIDDVLNSSYSMQVLRGSADSAVELGDGVILNLTSSAAFSGTLSGVGGLASSGSVVLNGATAASVFNFSGADASMLQGGIDLRAGHLVVNAADTQMFGLTTAAGTVLELGPTGELDLQSGNLAGTISGNGSLTKSGTGILTIAGANVNYTGEIAIDGGTVIVSNANALGEGHVMMTDGRLDLTNAGGAVTLKDLESTGATAQIDLGATALTLDNSADDEFTGELRGSGAITKNGLGSFTLSGDNTNYRGTVTANSGTLILTSANALNNATGVVLANLAVLQINGGSDSIRINNLTTGQATVVDLLSDLTVTSGIVDGKITGSSNLTKDGIGTLVLSGDNTGFVGNVDIKAGTLQIDSELSLGDRTTTHGISIAAGANLVFNNDKTGSENEWLLDATYFDITGAGNFRKQGAGWMRMEGEFAYTGTTYIDGGVLRLADGSSLVTGSIDISKDATLHINDGSTITTSIITGNGTLVMDSGNLNVNTDGKNITYNIKIAGFGEIHKQGEGVLTIANQNDDYIGKVFVEDGALKLGNDRALARADSITLVEDNSDGSSGEGRLIVGAGIHAVIDGLYSSTIDGTVSGDEDQPLAGTATRIDLGIAGNSLSVSRGDFSGVISGEGDLIKDNIGGKGTVDEDLRLILRSRNLYTGATFVNAGVLELRDANAINRSKTATIGGTGFLEFNVGLNGSEPIVSEPTCPALGPDSDVVWNYDGQIASAADGEGTVVKSGLGELILSGDNTNFSGKIKITEGRLTIEERVAMGSATSVDLGTLHDVQAAVDINGDSVVDALDTVQVAGTLWVKHNDDWNFNTVLVGEGNFVKDGSGTMTIANANNYSGITTIHGGTLIAANQLALGKSKVVVDALGRLQLGADLALDNLGGTGDVLLSDINDQNAAGFTLTLNTTSTEGQVWMFDGHFLGTGSIVKMGRGEWIVGKSLEGNINLDVREGTLTITDPGLYSSTRTYAVANDATLGLMMTGTFDSTVTGAGGVLVRAMDVSKFDLTTLGCFGYGVTSLANLEYPVDLTDPTQLAEFRDALGVLTVTGTNTYTGRTIVDAGTLRMGNDAALGTSNVVELREFMTINGTTVESLGTLDLNGHSLTLGGLTGNGTVAFGVGNGGGTLTITGDGVGAQDMTYTGNLVGDTGTLKLDSSNPTPFTLAGIVTKTNSYGDAITPEFAGTMLVEKGELVLDRQVLSVDPVTHVPTYDAGSDVLAKADVKVNGSDASLVAAKNANNIIGDLTVDGGIVELKGSSDGVNLTATTLTLNSGSKLVFSNNLSTASTATLEIKERMTLNAGTVEVSAPVPVVNPSDLDALYSYLLATVDSGIIDGGVDKVKLAEKNYGTVADAGKVLALRDRPSGLVFGYRLAEVDNSGSTDLVLKAATILNSTVVNADLKPVVDALNETLVSDDRANMPDIVKLVANTSSLATKQTLDQIGEAFSPGVTAGAAVRVANDAAEALGGTIGGRTAKITPMATVVKKMSSNDRLSASTDDETAVMPTALATEESTIWGSAVASTAKYGSGITSARENTYGGVIGFEKTDGQTTIGFFVSGLTSDVKGDMGEKVDMNGLYVGTYAARDGGLFFADGNLMAGHIWSDTTREGKIVAGSTTDSYSAEGEYGTNMASAFGEIGMKFEVDPWYYRGALGLKYTYVNSEGYTEDTANGDYALDIGSITKNSLAASLDLRAGRRFNTSWGTTGSAEFRVGYIQELLGTSVSTDVAMAGMPNSSYSHDGAGLSSGKFILGFDYGVGLNDQLTLKAGVLAEVGTDSYNRISGNLKLDWVF